MVKEKFLIDSNIFITPYQNFYPFDIAPGFWKQMESKLTLEEVLVLEVEGEEGTVGEWHGQRHWIRAGYRLQALT